MNTPCHSYLAVGLAVLALAACQQAPQVPEASSAAAQPTEQTAAASSAGDRTSSANCRDVLSGRS